MSKKYTNVVVLKVDVDECEVSMLMFLLRLIIRILLSCYSSIQYALLLCDTGFSISRSMQYDVLNLMVPDIFSNKNSMSFAAC